MEVLVLLCLVLFCIPAGLTRLGRYRRKHHPEYFEYFGAVIRLSNEVYKQTDSKIAYFEYHFKLIYDGLRAGECTVEYFQERLNQLNQEYIEFVAWLEARNKEIDELTKKANSYAKEHNFMWGVLRDRS